jgi:hypothetical protein
MLLRLIADELARGAGVDSKAVGPKIAGEAKEAREVLGKRLIDVGSRGRTGEKL